MQRYWIPAILTATLALSAEKGQVTRIKVHGVGLEGNLSGDAADRDVTVYLPPSYQKSPNRRFPVVYLLHGFTDSDEKWMGYKKHFVNVPELIDAGIAAGAAKEMIVVMPNAYTRFAGSMYSTSAAVGDWEGFVAKELVTYIDRHYRTLAQPESRGLAGHSMGGYGTIRLAMKRPGVFTSVYAMSPCCLVPPVALGNPARVEAIQNDEDFAKADFGTKAALASAAAWSANPKNPPLFLDLPVKNGETQPSVMARWAANAPVAMAGQYLGNLKALKAIAIDMGDKDRLMSGAKELVQILDANGVAHSFETYDGDHVNHVSDRVAQQVLPFFSRHLVFEMSRQTRTK